MPEKKHRLFIIISFVTGIILLFAVLISFWNAFPKEESVGVMPLIFAFLTVASFGFTFKMAMNLSDVDLFEGIIEEKVAAGRADMLQELKKKEETDSEVEEAEDIQETVKALLPSGNFKNIDSYGKKLLVNLANKLNLVQAVIYVADNKSKKFTFSVGYALPDKAIPADFIIGENLNGEAAKNQEIMMVDEIPETYFDISSGLGESKPKQLIIVPIISDKKTIALIELASFVSISEKDKSLVEQSAELIANKLKQLIKA